MYKGVRKLNISRVVIIFCLAALSSAQAAITQSEVDDWSSSQFCYMRMLLTNDTASYQPGIVFDAADICLGFGGLAYDIANLGLGYTGQEVLNSFTAVVEQPPLGEVANGWKFEGMDQYGNLLIRHDADSYDLWTTEAGSNDLVLTILLDKKYLGPDARLILNHNVYCAPFVALTQYGPFIYQANDYTLVPEPATLLLLASGILLIRKNRQRTPQG